MAGSNYGYAPAPVDLGNRPTSGLAIAGFILALIPIPFTFPIGLILSVIAIFLTGPGSDKKGRGFAIAGTIVALVWSALWGWGGYQMFSIGKLFAEDGQRVIMYGMEIRARKYYEAKGQYPATLEEFWDNEWSAFEIDRQQGAQSDLRGIAQLIRYELPHGPKMHPVIRGHGMFDDGIKNRSLVHAWGVNPLPAISQRMRDHPFVSDEAASVIEESIEKYFAKLESLPHEDKNVPSPIPPGESETDVAPE